MVPEKWLRTVVNVSDVSLYMLLGINLATLYYMYKHETSEQPSLHSVMQEWPEETHQRILVVRKYYVIGLCTLLVCSGIACTSTKVQNYIKTHYIITSVGTTLGLFMSMLFVHNFSYEEKYRAKLFFFVMHCILTTPTICTLGGEICLKAAFCTSILIAVLVLVALKAPQDFHLNLVGPLSKVNIVVVVASIFVTLIGTPKTSIEIVILCVNIHLGFFFFAGMHIVNIQLLLTDCKNDEEKFDPIYTAAVMEISTLNLFLRMATLVTLKVALRKMQA